MRPHTYNVEDLFTLDTCDPVHLRMVSDYILLLHKELLPKLGLFQTFEIYLVKTIGNRNLGSYISGTHEWPVCAVCMSEILREVNDPNRRLSLRYVVETTILHELAHAIQEWFGMPFVEEEAEEFAMQYYKSGTVYRFWK